MDFASHVSRQEDIAGMRLTVLDGLFSGESIASIYTLLRNLPYRLE